MDNKGDTSLYITREIRFYLKEKGVELIIEI
jgi:hypothetical protein